jgi:hypothetical protein
MLNFTYALGSEVSALYLDGKLITSKYIVDVEDLLIYANGEPFKIKKVYLDDEWVRKIVGFVLPHDEKDLLLADE